MSLSPTVVEFNWPTPIPLEQTSEDTLPYPIHCLPAIIGDAVMSYQAYGKQPLSLIACSAHAKHRRM